MKKNLMDLRNARLPEQRKQMEQIMRKGICPFCRENFEDNHKAPILFENEYWILTENDYPYEGSQTHLLVVHKAHIEHLVEISSEAFSSLGEIARFANDHYDLRGGALILRFGEMKYTGATLSHLHFHLVRGEEKNGETEALRVKVGYKKK